MQEVKDYLDQLYNADIFKTLPSEKQDSALFTAFETLKDYYPLMMITPRIIALQTLFMLEGESEEYARLKRHGVKVFSTKGITVDLDGSAGNTSNEDNGPIAPDVIAILGKWKHRAKVGRLR
jgi:hypothetical protein